MRALLGALAVKMDGGDAGTKKKSTESAAKHKGKGQSRTRSCGTFDDDSHGSGKPLSKKRCMPDLSQMYAKAHDGKSLLPYILMPLCTH